MCQQQWPIQKQSHKSKFLISFSSFRIQMCADQRAEQTSNTLLCLPSCHMSYSVILTLPTNGPYVVFASNALVIWCFLEMWHIDMFVILCIICCIIECLKTPFWNILQASSSLSLSSLSKFINLSWNNVSQGCPNRSISCDHIDSVAHPTDHMSSPHYPTTPLRC